jgi:Ni2+-binding GTPase involved in maturation of urease and hydrogenase
MFFILYTSLCITSLLFSCVAQAHPISHNGCVELIIFSRNRPMQLTATLESIEKHITGFKTITVLCHTENDAFLAGYHNVQKEFPYVKFVMQERENRQAHFKKQLLDIVEKLQSPYLMFAVDDIVVIDKVDLIQCCTLLQATGAYSFHLRVGADITNSSKKTIMAIPPLQQIKGGMYAWYIHEAGGFDSYFGYPYSVDMTIFPRAMVLAYTRRSQCVSPNTFEGHWNWSTPPLPQGTRGLCYPTSRMVNIELNLVQEGWTPETPQIYSAEQLLQKYNQGLRIDVDALFQYPHKTCHVSNIVIPWRAVTA